MLDSLKDLYISHPFMPVASPEDWYQHIKDIRCVVTKPASNIISQYKNGNHIRAWLLSVSATQADIDVHCAQLGDNVTVHVPLYVWTHGAPSTDSYILVDEAFNPFDVVEGRYELQPDVLVFMQEAPKLSMQTEQGPEIQIKPGYNVSVSKTQDGVMFFGAAGAGLDKYKSDPIHALGNGQKGYGARSINGLTDSIWLKGSFPVAADMNTPFELTIEVKE